MEKAPVYETGECRFDPCRRRSSRRSSVDESTALRRRGSHVRVVPARPCPCSSARQSASPVRTRSWVQLPPRAPSWKGSGQMRSPLATRVRVDGPCGCESHHFRSWKRPGWMRSLSRKQVGAPALGRSSRPASATPRWSNGDDAGPSTRRPGFDSPSRYSMPDRPTGRTAVCSTAHGGSSPPLAEQSPGGRGSRHAAADRVTGVRVPPGRPCRSDARDGGTSHHCRDVEGPRCKPEGQAGVRPSGSRIAAHVVVVQRRGCEHATLVMRVRVPPATPTDSENGGGGDMPKDWALAVLGRDHGPEALTVERPVETRQEEIRALLGPPPRRVAQAAAHLHDTQAAGGSSPPASTRGA